LAEPEFPCRPAALSKQSPFFIIMERRILRLVAILFCSLFALPGYAQMSKSVALLKGDVSLPDGTKLPGISVSIFKGTEKTSSTKTSPEGKFTTILQPNATYRIAVSNNGYMYHEENVRVPVLDAYQEMPVHIVLIPLRDGQPFDLPMPVFGPKSSTIDPQSVSVLDRIAEEMKHNAKLSVAVKVYPDAPVKSKKDADQQKLASARETAIRSYFLGKNINGSRFTVAAEPTVVPPGRFPPSPSAPPPAPPKKKKGAAAPPPGLIPQYIEITAHVAS
jgi:hypothetical protein